MPDYTYFIQMGDEPRFKVGATGNPPQRLKDLQTANPARLRYYAKIECVDNFGLEGYLHWHLKYDNAIGEWFNMDPLDVDGWLRTISQGHLKYQVLRFEPKRLWRRGALIFDWQKEFDITESFEGWELGTT